MSLHPLVRLPWYVSPKKLCQGWKANKTRTMPNNLTAMPKPGLQFGIILELDISMELV
jgi:hypothetical protein